MSLRNHASESINKMIQTIKNDQASLDQELSDLEKTKRKIEILKNSIDSVISISPDEIKLKHNVRHKVDENSSEFKKLCESIKTFGLMKNIVAELKISEDHSSYEIICIAGHRRLTALNKLGLKERIPCLLKSYKKSEYGKKVGAALSENLNREGLNCTDIANGYKDLINAGWTEDDLVKHFEKSKNTIKQYLRIAEFADDIKELIRSNPEKLSTRVIFREILTKGSSDGEIRKLIHRKIETIKKNKPKEKISLLKEKLNSFFEKEQLSDPIKQTVLEAFKFVGVWK